MKLCFIFGLLRDGAAILLVAKCNFGDKGVPKYNLGTREEACGLGDALPRHAFLECGGSDAAFPLAQKPRLRVSAGLFRTKRCRAALCHRTPYRTGGMPLL